MPVFEAHSDKQEKIILSDANITLALTGIQFGKTTSGAIWSKRKICAKPGRGSNHIITAPNYKIMQQSTLPAFLRHMEGLGEYKKVDACFELSSGATVFLRTATEPDSVVGITNVESIWGDEAGKYSLYFWENLQARASFRRCPILLTTTPYTSNWIQRELVKPVKLGKRTDVNLIQASSDENSFFPKEEFEHRRRTMDPRRFAALYLGEFEKMHGLVYDCFSEEVHVIKPIEYPIGTKFYGGIDWGYTDPFVLNVRAVLPNGHHILASEFYRTGMTVNDMIVVAKLKKSSFGIERFYADPSQPGHIEEFNRNGLSCVGADNDIRRGIDAHYDLIRSGRYHVVDSAVNTIDELSMYHYPGPEELGPDQDGKEQLPVGQNDHAMDAERYLSLALNRSNIKHRPKDPDARPREVTHEEKIKQLMRQGRSKFKGSESW